MDRSRRRRPSSTRALVLVAVAAVVGVACSDAATPTAATVNSERIARSDLDDELETLIDNELFRTQALGLAEAEPTVDMALASSWLENLIFQSIIDAEVERRDLAPTDEDRATARADLEATLGPDVLNAFPADFQETLVERGANLVILQRSLAGPAATVDEQEAFFDENVDLFRAQCPSDRAVAHILVETLEEADEIRALLDEGEDFASLAAQRSLDPGSAAAGGDLGCAVEGQFVPEFEQAMLAAVPGVPTEPVETDFGFHVLLVDEPFVTFARFQPAVAAELERQASTVVGDFFTGLLADVDVEVDSRYGTWVDDETGTGLQPPQPPRPREGREPAPEPTVALDPFAAGG